ncbi:hypothetical protein XpopCFBP1817_09845 [Xanthomonas populi]|uniref:Uncharacterized protein n=1 Tax=Xanthomonas populi TaxID=53414 RepID=A0A2S7EPJ1_9XANT|nr:hypothetical protein XpopCFBP1817_09845 [Xanthomonas populi]
MRGAASGVGTRRESIPGDSVAASMPPHGPAPGYDPAPSIFASADRQANAYMEVFAACPMSVRVQARSVTEANAHVFLSSCTLARG